MLAQMLRPNAAEHEPMVEHIALALLDRAAAGTTLHLEALRRSIVNAYLHWWLALPWWKVLWLTGSAERRFRTFADHARRCGLLDKWLKRAMSGLHAVG